MGRWWRPKPEPGGGNGGGAPAVASPEKPRDLRLLEGVLRWYAGRRGVLVECSGPPDDRLWVLYVPGVARAEYRHLMNAWVYDGGLSGRGNFFDAVRDVADA